MAVTFQEHRLGLLTSLGAPVTLPATYTINIWVKNVTLPGQEWSNLYQQSSGYKYVLDANYGAIGTGTAPRLAAGASSPLQVADTWHLVSAVYDGSIMEYYVNGVSIGSITPTSPPSVIDVLNGPAGQGFAAEVKDMRVYSGVATASEILASYNAGDGDLLPLSLADGLVLHHDCDDEIAEIGSDVTFTDVSIGSSSGRTHWDFANLNSKALLDVSNLPDMSGDWTVSMWFSEMTAPTTWRSIAKSQTELLGVVSSPHHSPANTLGVYTTTAFVSAGYSMNYLNFQNWNHMVIVGSGTTTKFYINGSHVGTAPVKISTDLYSINNQPVGAYNQLFANNTDDVRAWSRALSEGEISALHSSTIVTPSLTDDLIHKWGLDADGSAEVGSVDLVAHNSATHIDNVGSLSEAGSGFHPATSIALNPSAGYTISTWFKGLKSNAFNQFVAGGSSGTDGNFAGSTAYYDIAFDSTDLYVWMQTSPYHRRSGYDIMSDTNLDTGWHNIVAAYDGTQTTFYVDGVQVGNPVTWSGSPSIQTFGSWNNTVGPSGRAPADFMDDIRVWKRTLSSTEVEELYNNGANPQGENNNMGQITFTFSGLLYDGFDSEGTWRLMQGATVWDEGTFASLGLNGGDPLVIVANNVPTTNIAGGVPIRLEVADVYGSGLGDGMFVSVGSGQLTMVGAGGGGVSSSSTFTFSEADSRILENTAYAADTSGFYVQWYSSGMDNSWGNTGDYSTGQLPQDGSVATWFQAIIDAASGGGGGASVVRTRIHHDQLRMPSSDEYKAELAGEFATPALAVVGGATPGSLLVEGLPLEYMGVDLSSGDYGVRGDGVGQMIVNKGKLDADIVEMEDLISDEETRALAAEAGIQSALDAQEAKEAAYEVSNDIALAAEISRAGAAEAGIQSALDAQEAKEAAYEVSNDAAVLVERSRIDDILTNVDPAALDSLTEIVTEMQDISGSLSDSIISVLGTHTSELSAHEAAYDAKMLLLDAEDSGIRVDFAAGDAAERAFALAARDANESARDASVEVIRAALQADVDANESFGDDDRALIRAEGAAALALLQTDVDLNEADGDTDRALIRTEISDAKAVHDQEIVDAKAIADAALASEAARALAAEAAEEVRALAAEAGIQSALDAQEAKEAAYEVSNDAAVLAERSRIDALLSGASVDLDQLVELVAAYELADTDIIDSIAAVQLDVNTNEAAYDAKMILLDAEDVSIRADFAAGDAAERAFALAARDANETARDAAIAADKVTHDNEIVAAKALADAEIANIKADLVSLDGMFQGYTFAPLTQGTSGGLLVDVTDVAGLNMPHMAMFVHVTLNGLVMAQGPDYDVETDATGITGFSTNIELFEGDVISFFGVKSFDLQS